MNCPHDYLDKYWDDAYGTYYVCDNCGRRFEDARAHNPLDLPALPRTGFRLKLNPNARRWELRHPAYGRDVLTSWPGEQCEEAFTHTFRLNGPAVDSLIVWGA